VRSPTSRKPFRRMSQTYRKFRGKFRGQCASR
jgi:hypothetical protein